MALSGRFSGLFPAPCASAREITLPETFGSHKSRLAATQARPAEQSSQTLAQGRSMWLLSSKLPTGNNLPALLLRAPTRTRERHTNHGSHHRAAPSGGKLGSVSVDNPHCSHRISQARTSVPIHSNRRPVPAIGPLPCLLHLPDRSNLQRSCPADGRGRAGSRRSSAA